MTLAKRPARNSLERLLARLVSMAESEATVSFRALALAAGLNPATDFVGVCLQDIDFRDEDLRGFNFSQADLQGADFRRANLEGVAFDGATIAGAIGLQRTVEDGRGEATLGADGWLGPDAADERSRTALEDAIRKWREALLNLDRDIHPDAWVLAQGELANALRALGRQTGNPGHLGESVAAFRAALDVPLRPPLERIVLLRGLGNAMRVQGEMDLGPTRLAEAAEWLRKVVSEAQDAGLALEVAKTREHLGNALRSLGERSEGTGLLEEAAATFCAALTDDLRRELPDRWARIQTRLGNTLTRVGLRARRPELLREAITAHRRALALQSAQVTPAEWARSKYNLGNALAGLGRMLRQTRYLSEAVEVYHEALGQRTREERPLQWSRTQSSLGIALCALGARRHGLSELFEARRAFLEALSVQSADLAPWDWARTHLELGRTLSLIGRRTDSEAEVAAAVLSCEGALALLEGSPLRRDRDRGLRVLRWAQRRLQSFQLERAGAHD